VEYYSVVLLFGCRHYWDERMVGVVAVGIGTVQRPLLGILLQEYDD
jgi:hypothetical protein